MKQKSSPTHSGASWLILVLLLALFLAACERPLQEEVTLEPAAPGEGTTPGVVLTPVVPGGTAPGLATPGLLPTPTSAVPGATAGAPEGGEAPTGGEDAQGGEDAEGTTEPPATEETTTPEGDVIYTVVAGDILGDIADRYGVTVEAIAAANNLPNVHTLEVGQQLLIPLSGETAGGEETGGEEPAGTGEQIHVVQPGDTLFRIGQQYGFTVDELVAYNSLADPNRLDVGQQIRIPPAE